MDFAWGWLGKSNKEKAVSEDEMEQHPRHRRKSWSEVVAGPPAKIEARAAKRSTPLSNQVSPTAIDPRATFTGEEVFAMLAKARNIPAAGSSNGKSSAQQGGGGEWSEYRSKSAIKKEKAHIAAIMGRQVSKKRKLSPREIGASEDSGCWICGETNHWKDECPFACCRYCKQSGHRIADCPTLPDHLKRVSPPKSNNSTKQPVNQQSRPRNSKEASVGTRFAGGRNYEKPANCSSTSSRTQGRVQFDMGRRSAKAIDTPFPQSGEGSSCTKKGIAVRSSGVDNPQTKPSRFIPLTDQAATDKVRLGNIISVIYPRHGNPSISNIIEGLHASAICFATHDWQLTEAKGHFISRFPSEEGLNLGWVRHSYHAKEAVQTSRSAGGQGRNRQ